MLKVKLKRLSPEAVMPSKGTDKSAGYDLTAISAFWDKERNQVKYFFGLAFEIPEGYHILKGFNFTDTCKYGRMGIRPDETAAHAKEIRRCRYFKERAENARPLKPEI